jgi:hypothetical protein
VPEATNPPSDPLGSLASEILADLYWAVCGVQPKAIRAYTEDDALLLLLRFEPDEIQDSPFDAFEPLLFTAFAAMPALIGAAVEARTGQRLCPGNLLLCAERGLAVLAFSAIDEDADERSGEDLFRVDSETFSLVYGDRLVLPVASR